MTLLTKCWKHFRTVCRHKWYVYQEMKQIPGLRWQGLVHDMSKFSFTEFVESAKYFQGNSTPINAAREAQGYAIAWLHHKGVNKHHGEWWCDFSFENGWQSLVMPWRYVMEMMCDVIGAGRAYNPKGWNRGEPLKYFQSRHRVSPIIHPKIKRYMEYMLEIYAHCGWHSDNWGFYRSEYNRIIQDTDSSGKYEGEQYELSFNV